MKNFFIIYFILILFNSCNSINNNSFLKKAIDNDANICPLIHTNDSNIILICCPSSILVEEVEKNNLAKAQEIVYQSLLSNKSILVSKKFYFDMKSFMIKGDMKMDSIYQNYGVSGLFKTYFNKKEWERGYYIIKNEKERFISSQEDSYPAFGLDHNDYYMSFLLAKHNIFLTLVSWDHILTILIDKNSSDMSKVKK